MPLTPPQRRNRTCQWLPRIQQAEASIIPHPLIGGAHHLWISFSHGAQQADMDPSTVWILNTPKGPCVKGQVAFLKCSRALKRQSYCEVFRLLGSPLAEDCGTPEPSLASCPQAVFLLYFMHYSHDVRPQQK